MEKYVHDILKTYNITTSTTYEGSFSLKLLMKFYRSMKYMFNIITIIIGLTFILRGKDGKYTLLRASSSENTLGNIKSKLSIQLVSTHVKRYALQTVFTYIVKFPGLAKRRKSRSRVVVRPTFHPATPMEEGESRVFRISQLRFNNASQPGKVTCGLNSKTFTVKKVKKVQTDYQGDFFNFFFYAISGINEFNEIQNGNETHKFESEVAFIRCRHGWLSYLEVKKNRLGVVSQESARGCGIGIVLTELCFIDPDINNMNTGNYALPKLEDDPQTNQLVKDNCLKVIGLMMLADPVAGARAYFSAAIRLGYEKLIIDPMSRRSSGSKFKIYDTKVAKENFDPNTGRIDPCCKETERCNTVLTNWFFCEINRRTDDWEPFGH